MNASLSQRCCCPACAGEPAPVSLAALHRGLRGLPSVQPIQLADQGRYRALLRGPWYGHAWSYVTQACRTAAPDAPCGYRYWDGRNLISIGLHQGHFVVVSPSGPEVVARLRALVQALHALSGRPVFLKCVEPAVANTLLGGEGFARMAAYPWSCQAPRDDATFSPVRVVLDDIVGDAIRHRRNRKVRLRANRFHNAFSGSTVELAEAPAAARAAWGPIVERVLLRWARNAPGRVAAYRQMISHPSEHALRFVLHCDGEPLGFYLLEPIGYTGAGCYANVCVYKDHPGIAEVGMLRVFEALRARGIRWVNLGGSEEPSLHRYKLKFGAVSVSSPAQLIFSGRAENSGERP